MFKKGLLVATAVISLTQGLVWAQEKRASQLVPKAMKFTVTVNALDKSLVVFDEWKQRVTIPVTDYTSIGAWVTDFRKEFTAADFPKLDKLDSFKVIINHMYALGNFSGNIFLEVHGNNNQQKSSIDLRLPPEEIAAKYARLVLEYIPDSKGTTGFPLDIMVTNVELVY